MTEEVTPDNPETVKRVNDENRSDVRQPLEKPVETTPTTQNVVEHSDPQ